MARATLRGAARVRKHSYFIADPTQHSTKLDRNARARLLAQAEALERSTKQPGARNGTLGQAGIQTLRTLLSFTNSDTGLCCPSIDTLAMRSGLARSTIIECLSRLESAGMIRRVRRIARAVVMVLGVAILSTIQLSNLYAFAAPSPSAHSQPVISRGAVRGSAASRVQRLVSGIVKGFEPSPASAGELSRLEKQEVFQ